MKKGTCRVYLPHSTHFHRAPALNLNVLVNFFDLHHFLLNSYPSQSRSLFKTVRCKIKN